MAGGMWMPRVCRSCWTSNPTLPSRVRACNDRLSARVGLRALAMVGWM
jgi:hypothetical protein